MPSTFSDLKIELIATGEQSNTWGLTTNTNLGTALEQAIVGKADVTMSSTTITLTLTDTNAAQDARALYLNLSGTPGGAATLEVPAIEKNYIVKNGSDQVVTIKVSGQTGVAIPVGKTVLVYNNGTDVVTAVDFIPSVTTTALDVSGTSASGGSIKLYEDTDNGTNYVAFQAPASVASDITWTLPSADGTSGQAIVTNGSGTLSFGNAGISTGKSIAMSMIFGF
jgi:hypothetical protein